MVEFLGVAFALLAGSSWSSRDVILKKGFVTLNPLLGVFVHMFTFFPVIFMYGLVTGQWSQLPSLTLLNVSFMAIGGLLQNVVGTSLFFSSIKLIGASRAGTFLPTQTLFAVTLAIIFLNEKWSPNLLAGAALVIIGAYAISVSMKKNTAQDVDSKVKVRGMLLAIAGAFVWGTGPLFFRLGLTNIGNSTWGALISGISAFIFGTAIFSRMGVVGEFARLKRKDLRLLLGAGTLDSLGIVVFLAGLSVAPVILVTPIVSARPLISVTLSYLFIQHLERINWKVLVGLFSVVSGVYLVIFT